MNQGKGGKSLQSLPDHRSLGRWRLAELRLRSRASGEIIPRAIGTDRPAQLVGPMRVVSCLFPRSVTAREPGAVHPDPPSVSPSRWNREDGIAPNRRWWFFILAVALASAGWWLLPGRGPRPDDEEEDGRDDPGLALSVPVSTAGADRSEASHRAILPGARDVDAPVAAAEPSGPQEAVEGTKAPRSLSGLEDLSTADGPAPAKSSAFDRLPGVDDELEPASARGGSGPGRGHPARRAGPAGRQAGRGRASFPRGATESGHQARPRPGRSSPRSTGWRAGSTRSARWPRRSGARPIAPAHIARRKRCSSSTWRWG